MMKTIKRMILMGAAVMTLMSFAVPAMAQSLYVNTASAWGDNSCGQLGDGTTTQRNTPVAVKDLRGVSALAAGDCLSMALKTDGTVWTLSPYGHKQVSGISGVSAIAVGGSHQLALKSDGTVWAWGDNTEGQLGVGNTTEHSNTPVQVKNLSGVKAIAAGKAYSLAVKTDGTVWAWGYNIYGQLGDGTTTTRYEPVQVKNLSGVKAIAAGYYHSLALKTDGTVRAWGDNSSGELGDGTTTTRYTPVQVKNLSEVGAIAAGQNHSLALKSDGTVRAWGKNSNGQLGDGTTTNRYEPVWVMTRSYFKLQALSGVSAIAAGQNHSLALKSDGTVRAWGKNSNGQLGDGTTTNRYTAVGVSNLDEVQALAAGDLHSLAMVPEEQVLAQ